MSAALAIEIRPAGAVLSGDHVDIRISGAAAGEEVTVIGRRRFWDDQKVLRSDAVFRADADGTVDLSRDAPVRGSYTGVHPAGIFWSMTVFGAAEADVPPTSVVKLEAIAGPARQQAEVTLLWELPTLARKEAPFPGAFLAALPGATRRPTIIGLGGSEGGAGAGGWYASKLGSRGYAVLAFPYYSPPSLQPQIPGLPTAFQEIPVDRLQAAYDWLCEQPEVDPDRIGLWGSSKGAEFALIAATKFPWIKAVVAHAPTDVVWEGWDDAAAVHVSKPCFSWQGTPLPYMPRADSTHLADHYAQIFDSHTRGREQHPREAETARIPIELYRHPLMLVAGGDDRLIQALDMAETIARRRAGAGLPTETLLYPEGGHQLGDDGYSSAEWSLRGGGTLQAQGVARREAFVKALGFLEATLGAVAR